MHVIGDVSISVDPSSPRPPSVQGGQLEDVRLEIPKHCYEDLNPRNSPHALLNSRKRSISSLSRSFGKSRNVLFGARYISMISRTTLSAFSMKSAVTSIAIQRSTILELGAASAGFTGASCVKGSRSSRGR